MAYEKTWSFSTTNLGSNNDVYKACTIEFNGIKTALLSTGLWTIYGCCGKSGGSTLIAPSSLPDATDRWTNTGFVFGENSYTAEQSWIILYNSTLNLYLTMSCFYLDYNGMNLLISFSQNAPTLNTTNAKYTPKLTNHICWVTNQIMPLGVSNYRINSHLTYTTQGHFILYTTLDNTTIRSMFMLLPIAPSRSSDTTPFVATYMIGGGSADYTRLCNINPNSKCFVPLLTPNTPTDSSFCGLYCRNPNAFVMGIFLNDASDNNINLYPIFVYGYTGGAKCFKGRVQDVYFAPSAMGNGDTILDASGNIEYIKIGPICIPANTDLIY